MEDIIKRLSQFISVKELDKVRELRCWTMEGEARLLAQGYGGRKLVSQNFRNPLTNEVKDFTIFSQPSSACILAFTPAPDRRVIATLQYKQSFNGLTLEVAAGEGNPNSTESPEELVRRELLEETGYEAGNVIFLGQIWPNTRNVWDTRNLFLALDCREMRQPKADPNEQIAWLLIPFPEWEAMIRESYIKDAQTIIATYLARMYLNLQ